MNVIYIFGIAILLMGGTDSLIEEKKTDKNNQQRILLRKLQNFQDAKPLTWNEVLADVLVNKIRIFSFKNEDKEDPIKKVAPVTKERTILTNFFSQIFVVYKKFIYDAFIGKKLNDDDNIAINEGQNSPKNIENASQRVHSEEIDNPSEVLYSKGPKSEVELVEPKYHGKLTFKDTPASVNSGEDNVDPVKNGKDVPNVTNDVNPEEQKRTSPEGKVQVNPSQIDSIIPFKNDGSNLNKEERVECPEGYVRNDSGNCVNNNSRLILAIPNQCPRGYRRDWLGNCRMIFHF